MSDTQGNRDHAEQTIRYIERNHGLRYFAQTLIGDTDPGRFETELDSGTRYWLEHICSEQPDNTKLLREFLTDTLVINNRLWAVENALVHEALQSVNHRTQRGTDRSDAAVIEATMLPDHLAVRVIQSEIDAIEGSAGYHPTDWESLIHLYQELSRLTSNEETRVTRKQLWDELLKYTEYTVTISYENASGDTMSDTFSQWAQDNATAHNDQLRSWRQSHEGDDVQYRDIETTPERLWEPQIDPLKDIEGWVHRGFWG